MIHPRTTIHLFAQGHQEVILRSILGQFVVFSNHDILSIGHFRSFFQFRFQFWEKSDFESRKFCECKSALTCRTCSNKKKIGILIIWTLKIDSLWIRFSWSIETETENDSSSRFLYLWLGGLSYYPIMMSSHFLYQSLMPISWRPL